MISSKGFLKEVFTLNIYSWPQRKNLRLQNYDYSQPWWYFVTICTKNREHFFGEIIDGEMILNKYWKIVHEEITSPIRKNICIDTFIIMPNHIHAIIVIHNTHVGCDWIAPKQNEFDWITMKQHKFDWITPNENINMHQNEMIHNNRSIHQKRNVYQNGTMHGTMQSSHTDPNVNTHDDDTIQPFRTNKKTNAQTLSHVIRWIKSRITSRVQTQYKNFEFWWQRSFYDVIIRDEEHLQKTQQNICDNPKNWDTDSDNIS